MKSILIIALMLFSGCASATKQIVYKDVLVPTKCIAEIPNKPKYESIEDAKGLMEYYLKVEALLLECVK
ncbi:hypothetical protein CPIN18021_0288 [Campylobacter pinnipediorum subsp. caledonicus]|uniref:Uncharacterized protein n=1 Tax=Campylobacter pinnipediorum subsp. caledonicus TaxID=1874362 RepID=A0A1S6U636_9BACT|nr:hypothetical protein [Campylobacter pinnipediorum]AQW85550.1 hypothetical protein CPIN18020_0309 [Campylobacter pinnipediorum subsp. caledonicus]AQW87135.1 hypothetical protein CPIN18021_0288 [Campylobacter pinnipediorum subsp. caledonicus]OPA71833.1 hypothetical protein BB381_06765 [Campylobacter pinnipediorum subsp. caledonicus]